MMAYLYSEVLYNNKTLVHPQQHAESHRCNVESKKSDTKEFILYGYIYTKFKNKQN